MRVTVLFLVLGAIVTSSCARSTAGTATGTVYNLSGTWILRSQPKDPSDASPFHDRLELRSEGTYTSTSWNSSWGDEQHPDITEGKWSVTGQDVTLTPEKLSGQTN